MEMRGIADYEAYAHRVSHKNFGTRPIWVERLSNARATRRDPAESRLKEKREKRSEAWQKSGQKRGEKS